MILDIIPEQIKEWILLPLFVVVFVDMLWLMLLHYDKKTMNNQLRQGKFWEPTIKLVFDILVLFVLMVISIAVLVNLYYDMSDMLTVDLIESGVITTE